MLNNKIDKIQSIKDAWPIAPLEQNKHYYLEDGLMVLTERYHLSRGTCCGNRCRHCPFDYINVID